MPDRREALRELSELLTEAARDVKVLSALSWPEHVVEAFLQRWRAGDRSLPTPPEPKARPDHVRERLEEVLERADWSDPVGQLLADTADSYLRILELLDYAGTPEAHRLSREIYGGPEARIPGSRLTNLEAADRLLEYTSALAAATPDEEAEYCVAPMEVASALRSRWDGFFETPIEIVVDPDLASKAAASASRVRLRASADFSANDVRQLAEHEIGVHSLTSRNGRGQPVLPSLGLGAPRTTATQEGLATFAELVTGAIDLARLRRLAYRVRAIHLAEQGANFLQVFEWLLSIGEPPGEAARTTMRIFRGGDVEGRHVFTKDVVYLRGLFAVHTFLRKAIAEHRPGLIARLFVGRLTLGDVVGLEEAFEDGTIAMPHYVPPWAANVRNLAAFLAFSTMIDAVDLGDVELEEVHASPPIGAADRL